ncbi:MAG: lipocalin family protein [Bacteroidota bacterium]
MKKALLLIFITIISASCATSKAVRETENKIDGKWTLTDINYPNSSGFFDVTLFGVANSTCFESSTWKFISNNNRGSVIVYDNDCQLPEQNIVWSLEENQSVNYEYDVLIKMDADELAKRKDKGSRLQLKEVNSSTMIWEMTVNFEGKPVVIELNFVNE